MARKKKTLNYILITTIILGLIGVLGALYVQRSSDTYRSIQQMPMEDYAENSLALVGNRYKVSGEVTTMLLRDELAGRLVAVDTKGGPIGILFPPTFSNRNIQKGQRIVVVGEVASNGVFKAVDFQKQ